MASRKYTLDELRSAVAASVSVRSCLQKLGLAPAGGNYVSIQRLIADQGLDTSHFKGQAIHRGHRPGPRRPLSEYLNNGRAITSYRLQQRLLREGVFEARCASCALTEWLGRPIPLELHHVDGDRENNRLENLSLLCPNCHAATDTYRGKNVRKRKGGVIGA
jgi:hypothetical protein